MDTKELKVSPAAKSDQLTHTVVKGDTLGAIARRYYGKAARYRLIFAANQPMLTDPDRIYPGQILLIPRLGPV